MIYFIIILSKLLENALTTLKIILIANNKKLIGALLTFVVSLIWVLSVSFIVVDFEDYYKIFCFAFGSGIGSYIGSIIEEKLALGYVIIIFKVDEKQYSFFKNVFKDFEKAITKTKNKYKFELNVKRKKQNKIIKIIKEKDYNIKINIIKVFNC